MGGSIVNTAVTVFADDCSATTSAVSIGEAFWLDNFDDKPFDHLHALANLKQNHAKAVHQVDVRGPGSVAVQRAFTNAGNQLGSKVFAAEARYLGSFLHTDNTYNKELERRIKSLNIVFNMWRRFWVAGGILIKLKTQFSKGIAIHIFSVVVTFALSPKNTAE